MPAQATVRAPIATMVEPQLASKAALVAKRWCVGSDGLARLLQSVRGLDVSRITTRDRELIDNDAIRVMALAKRGPVPEVTPSYKIDTLEGNTWVIDGFPSSVSSPIDGTTYQYVAACIATTLLYLHNVKTHTMEDLIAFTDLLDAFVFEKHGRHLVYIRLDQAPEQRTDQLRVRLAQNRASCSWQERTRTSTRSRRGKSPSRRRRS
jgi:hypothetical protein